MSKLSSCPVCNGVNLYRSISVAAAGGYGPNFLPGLGNFLNPPRFNLMTCEDCGFTGFFANREAREKLSKSDKWEKI